MFKAAFLCVLWVCIFRDQRSASYAWMEIYKWTLRVSSSNLQSLGRYCMLADAPWLRSLESSSPFRSTETPCQMLHSCSFRTYM